MINLTNIKLTQNQLLIVNALLSMLASAFVGAAQAGYQYLTQHGTINISQVFVIFISTLWITFSTALVAYVPAHVQQELEALREFQAQVTAQPVASTPATPHVVIYAQGASVQSSDGAPKPATVVPAVAIPTRPVAPPKPVQLQTVVEPAQQTAQQPQQVWLATTMSGSSGVQQAATDDVLGDLPSSTGQPMQVQSITGVVPVYGASGKEKRGSVVLEPLFSLQS